MYLVGRAGAGAGAGRQMQKCRSPWNAVESHAAPLCTHRWARFRKQIWKVASRQALGTNPHGLNRMQCETAEQDRWVCNEQSMCSFWICREQSLQIPARQRLRTMSDMIKIGLRLEGSFAARSQRYLTGIDATWCIAVLVC